jgi:hypothetical protein
MVYKIIDFFHRFRYIFIDNVVQFRKYVEIKHILKGEGYKKERVTVISEHKIIR